jgi:hypothetical protein
MLSCLGLGILEKPSVGAAERFVCPGGAAHAAGASSRSHLTAAGSWSSSSAAAAGEI